MLKITKQLTRNDGGKILSGSLLKFDIRLSFDKKEIAYFLKHFINQRSIDEVKKEIKQNENFPYRILKTCSNDEWLLLNNNDGAYELFENWLKIELDGIIGVGNTEII